MIKHHLNLSLSFGSSSREHPSKYSQTVGPGSYNVRSLASKSNGFTISGKFDSNREQQDDKPGPGQYDPVMVSSHANIRIGSSARSDMISRSNAHSPGPGEYE